MFDQNNSLRFLRLLDLLLRLTEYTIERVDDRIKVRRYLIVPHLPTVFPSALVDDVHALDQLEQFVGEILSLLANLPDHLLLEFLSDLLASTDRLRSHDESSRHLLELLVRNVHDLKLLERYEDLGRCLCLLCYGFFFCHI